MNALWASLFAVGCGLIALAVVWSWRTRHERHLWRTTRHDTATVAIVLELEEKVRELEQLVDSR